VVSKYIAVAHEIEAKPQAVGTPLGASNRLRFGSNRDGRFIHKMILNREIDVNPSVELEVQGARYDVKRI
jgi:hypothetical protein